MKDLSDVALLATISNVDALTLSTAIRETHARREQHAVPTSLPPPAAAREPLYARMAATDALAWSTLDELVHAVRAFLDAVLAGIAGRWGPPTSYWRDEPDGFESANAENLEPIRPESDR